MSEVLFLAGKQDHVDGPHGHQTILAHPDFAQFGAEGVSGFNIYSMFVAVIGAIVVLLIYHAIVGRKGF